MRAVAKYPMTSLPESSSAREIALQQPDYWREEMLCIAPDEGDCFSSYRTVDSLGLYPEAVGAVTGRPTGFLNVSAESFFGPQSSLVVEPVPSRQEHMSLTDNAVFQGFVLLLAVAYGMMLYHCLGEIRMLLSRISRDTASGERFYDNSGNNGFSRFLNTVAAIGALFLGVMAVKYADSLLAEHYFMQLSYGMELGLGLLMTLVFLIIFLVQWGVLIGIGALTLARSFITQLQQLRRTFFALMVVVVTPILLLFALCPRGTGGMWFLLIVIELAATAFLYFKETLNLFLSKKISILHWFLYLCGVEIFPISLVWLAITR